MDEGGGGSIKAALNITYHSTYLLFPPRGKGVEKGNFTEDMILF